MDMLANDIDRIADDLNNFKNIDINTAVKHYKAARDCQDYIKSLLEKITNVIDKARHIELPLKFKEEGVTSITVEGYRYTISHTTRASINKDKREEAFEWLRDNDLGDLITETVNASTLSSTAAQLMGDGGELDQDLFNVYIMENVSVTKSIK